MSRKNRIATETEDIGRPADAVRLPVGLFGRKVAPAFRRSARRRRSSDPPGPGPRHAEIDHARLSLAIDEHVARIQVLVGDALLVGQMNGVGDGRHGLRGPSGVERSVLGVLFERRAGHVFEHQEHPALVEVDVVNPDEVPVRGQRGEQPPFVGDAVEHSRVGRAVRELQHDRVLKTRMHGAKRPGLAPLIQRGHDGIAADLREARRRVIPR